MSFVWYQHPCQFDVGCIVSIWSLPAVLRTITHVVVGERGRGLCYYEVLRPAHTMIDSQGKDWGTIVKSF